MKRRSIFLAMLSFVLAMVCSGQAAEPVKVTFYHTSDLHEHSVPLPRIARFVAEQKKKDPNTLLLDTGDWCNKGDLTPLNTRGEAIVEMMAASGYDAVIAGNHDFSFGGERLAELVDKYSTPLLDANCKWAEKVKPKAATAYRVFKLDGVTVGVIGTSPPFVGKEKGPSVKIEPIAKAIAPFIAELTGEVDIIVVMTHIGPPEDKKLAKACPEIDIIFGGHYHHRFNKLSFDKSTKTVIQHSGAMGKEIGKVVVTWDGSKIADRQAGLVKITDKMPPDEDVEKIAEKYRSK